MKEQRKRIRRKLHIIALTEQSEISGPILDLSQGIGSDLPFAGQWDEENASLLMGHFYRSRRG
jgi:hypothetical protein